MSLSRLGAPAEASRHWAEIRQGVQLDEWPASGRCQGWDVACVYAHHTRFPVALSRPPQPTAHDSAGNALLTPAEILRRFNAANGGSRSNNNRA